MPHFWRCDNVVFASGPVASLTLNSVGMSAVFSWTLKIVILPFFSFFLFQSSQILLFSLDLQFGPKYRDLAVIFSNEEKVVLHAYTKSRRGVSLHNKLVSWICTRPLQEILHQSQCSPYLTHCQHHAENNLHPIACNRVVNSTGDIWWYHKPQQRMLCSLIMSPEPLDGITVWLFYEAFGCFFIYCDTW